MAKSQESERPSQREAMLQHWGGIAIELLEGRTIQKAFFQSEDETRDWDWNGNRGLVLVLDDGTRCTVCADPEMNGPGSLHVVPGGKAGTQRLGPL